MENSGVKTAVDIFRGRLYGMHGILINENALSCLQSYFLVVGKKFYFAVVDNDHFKFRVPVPPDSIHIHF